MRKECDFSQARRGPVRTTAPGKTRINDALREHIGRQAEPLEAAPRRVLREELTKHRNRSKDGR